MEIITKVIMTDDEKIDFFKNALDNIYGTGYWNGYGLVWDWNEEDYGKARVKLDKPCIEDVFLQMLKDGCKINIIDEEGEGAYDASFTLDAILANMELVPVKRLQEMNDEQDDAETADVILQTILWKETIFG